MNNNEKTDREESRFAKMLGTIDSSTDTPDKAFLEQLKIKSTQTFLAAEINQPTHERTKKMKFYKKFIPTATAACIIVGITLAVVFFTVGNGGASITWADVQQNLRNARTMTCKVTMQMEGSPNKMEAKMMFKEPGLIRSEIMRGPSKNSIKSITIMDLQRSKMISLLESQEPKLKRAIVSDLTELSKRNLRQNVRQNILGMVKQLIEKSETELGEKKIDGRTVKGYRVEKGNKVITIWADAKTAQPVEMSMEIFQRDTKISMADIKFDVKLDNSLFSLDIPEGYEKLERPVKIQVPKDKKTTVK